MVAFDVLAQDDFAMKYLIDVTRSLDTFEIELEWDGKLKLENEIFQFAATAPGTYQTMDIGRFVSDFRAYDKKNRLLEVEQLGVNQFRIDQPKKSVRITYKVAETFDTKVKKNPVYLMAGSSIEEDHTLINSHTMLGYFHGLQGQPIHVKLERPESWRVGTALPHRDQALVAENFDHMVDSPILAGKLTYADTILDNTRVEIYTYSANNKISSTDLLSNMSGVLDASKQFLVELPVDRYTFLYHFEPNPPGQTGAWEHSYSSEFVMPEGEFTPSRMKSIEHIASHEFFHIVTPLNIHSEIIEQFNFVSPTPSSHLWLYEGVTEWASNILLYRGGKMDLNGYLKEAWSKKIMITEKYFREDWSLQDIALRSYAEEGQKQYGNIYYKGSLVAGLLDIRLLELSEGKLGLRELILNLVEKYGKGNPVSEETFIEDIVDMTYPEIGDFFNKYVLGSEDLPYEEYLKKIGLKIVRPAKQPVSVFKAKKLTSEQGQLFDAWSQNLSLQR